MTKPIKKSVLCDLVARHSDFNFEQYMANTARENYDVWNGFCLPMHYSNAAEEYKTLRDSCALFDASPMKKYHITGTDADKFLDRILTAPISQMPPMRAAYGLICNDAGYLIDDGIVNKYASDDYLLLVSELELDDHFAKYNDFDDLTIIDETASFAGVAIQGPKSCAVLQQFGFNGVEQLEPFELKYFDLSGHQILIGRLGFTGDLGYEVWFNPEAIDQVTQAINDAEKTLDIKMPGYGLTVVNICRLEAGMIVPGWDTTGTFENLDFERTPFELTLGWNVKLASEHDFVGKVALTQLKAEGPRFKMKGIKINDSCVLEDGQHLFATINGGKTKIGTLPSVVWHENENCWIGFASIFAEQANAEAIFVICNDTNKQISANICKIPFINLPHRNQVPAN